MDKYLLLKVKDGRGCFLDLYPSWNREEIIWEIFSDRTCRVTVRFIPGRENRGKRKKLRQKTMSLSVEQFDTLLEALSIIDWDDLPWDDFIYDGDCWEITHYSPEGVIIGSSGRIMAVYSGILGRIIDCLPEPDESMFELEKQ